MFCLKITINSNQPLFSQKHIKQKRNREVPFDAGVGKLIALLLQL
jgi:hypothetical protein